MESISGRERARRYRRAGLTYIGVGVVVIVITAVQPALPALLPGGRAGSGEQADDGRVPAPHRRDAGPGHRDGDPDGW